MWATAKQRHVPAAMLGRVSSLDWLISIGLLPLSFALTGPVSAAIGVRATLVAAGVLGAAVTFAALLLPGMRSVEGRAPAPARGAARRSPSRRSGRRSRAGGCGKPHEHPRGGTLGGGRAVGDSPPR